MLPVNFCLDGEDVLLRTAPGMKLSAARGSRVAFEADDIERLYRSGWSVVIHGIADEVADPAALEGTLAGRLRPWSGGAKDRWVRITPVQVAGRRLRRAWSYPDPT